MDKNEQNEDNGVRKPLSSYAKFSGMAFQMIFIIGLCTFIGYKIDESAGHKTQWVTAVLALFGVFVSLFLMFRSLKS